MDEVTTIKIVDRQEGDWFPKIGQAFVINSQDEGRDTLMMRCPRCGQGQFLSKHELTIEADGSPTITPSIGCQQCRYHAYLRNGKLEVLSDF